MRLGRREAGRTLAAAGVGLASVVWAVVQAAQGDWAFYALALALTVATNLTVAEISGGKVRKL